MPFRYPLYNMMYAPYCPFTFRIDHRQISKDIAHAICIISSVQYGVRNVAYAPWKNQQVISGMQSLLEQ